MNRFTAALIALIVMGLGFWYVIQNPPEGEQPPAEVAGEPFSADGNVVRDNPGLAPGVWHLVYEEPGAPGRTVRLDLSGSAAPALSQGQRVHVEGTLKDGTVSVTSIAPAAAENTMTVKLYYYNPSLDQGPGGPQCSERGLVAVERVIPRTIAPLSAAISLLLRGELTGEERAAGITTEFPLPGVELASAAVASGVATLAFADPENRTGGGSCRVAVLWHQIEATAKQFPGVQEVRFTPEELFQP